MICTKSNTEPSKAMAKSQALSMGSVWPERRKMPSKARDTRINMVTRYWYSTLPGSSFMIICKPSYAITILFFWPSLFCFG